jgi:hypothetical protein
MHIANEDNVHYALAGGFDIKNASDICFFF